MNNIRIKELIYKTLSLFKRDCKLEQKNTDIIFFGGNARTLIKDSKLYENLQDSVIDELRTIGYEVLSIDPPFSNTDTSKCWNRVCLYNKLFLIEKIAESVFKINFNPYDKILDKNNPKIIITFNAGKKLCISAKKRNIPVYEYLHAVGYAEPIPWGWDMRTKNELPDFIVCRDAVSYATFSTLKNKVVDVIYTTTPTVNLLNEDKKEIYNFKNRLKNKKYILICLQWGYDGESDIYKGILNNGVLYEDFGKVFKKTEHEIIWGIKFHQVQLTRSQYKTHVKYIKEISNKHKNVEWLVSSKSKLEDLLKLSSGLITMSSTTVEVAARHGVNSLALCPTLRDNGFNKNYYTVLENEGYVSKTPFDVENIVKWALQINKVCGKIDSNKDDFLHIMKQKYEYFFN